MLEHNSDSQLLVSVLEKNFGNGAFRHTPDTLAAALAASPRWAEMPRSALVVRPAPEPILGVVGDFDAAGRARLEGLRWQLETFLPRLRYVSYECAEEDARRLAELLTRRFGREALQEFRFTAIPRGGFIVLGMLAYALGLQHSQLEPPHPPDRPLVVVDDCALSGLRFGRFLESVENRQIVFASLYSPPELRQAIESRERREITCLSAHDLRDHAPASLGEEYPAWRERWMQRMDERGYWVGQPDHVCFAWNEPDIGIWNPVNEREESGWHLVPPDLCLKNRPTPGANLLPVQVQPEGRGPLRPSPRVLFAELDGELVIGNFDTGESFVLDGAGADMWRAILRHGNLDEAAEALGREYEVEAPILRHDLHDFVEDLLCRDLLARDE
jgi:hypothetical protein